MHLDKNSPVPLYHQLKNALIKLIEERYHPGDAIPTESELESAYNVSRVTVRQAVTALVKEGIVYKQQGRGTFVQKQRIAHQLTGVTSWTNQIRQRGLEPQTRSLFMERISPSLKLQQTMGIGPEEQLIHIMRVRYAGEEPMCIMVNYLLEKKVPDFLENEPQFESLYQYLDDKYGIVIHTAQETVQARKASDEVAAILQIAPGAPILYVSRLSYLDDGQVFEVVHVTSRADRFEYTVMLSDR